eukprot:749827-Hanusia_phi.AAC.1
MHCGSYWQNNLFTRYSHSEVWMKETKWRSLHGVCSVSSDGSSTCPTQPLSSLCRACPTGPVSPTEAGRFNSAAMSLRSSLALELWPTVGVAQGA